MPCSTWSLANLLTPAGLRTLSPKDPAYCAAYKGGPDDRDCAYHQGTVWPWLMGPFLSAYVKVHGGSQSAREQAAEWLRGFEVMMTRAGLGQLPELADADDAACAERLYRTGLECSGITAGRNRRCLRACACRGACGLSLIRDYCVLPIACVTNMIADAENHRRTSIFSFPIHFDRPIKLNYYGGERTIMKRDAMLIRVETDKGIVGYAPGQGSERAQTGDRRRGRAIPHRPDAR